MDITLSREDIERCVEFSNRCAVNQQRIEFGQSDTQKRSLSETGRDNLIGKIAEIAFAKMMWQRYGITVSLDFDLYPRGEWDKDDTTINGWSIDVKGTREGGQWLLVEWNKLAFRRDEKKLPHLFVMASVGWDRQKDCPAGTVDLKGFVPLNQLRPGVKNTLVLRKGDFIPQTRTRLQADNYAIHFSNLMTNWDQVINWVRNNAPPNTDKYPNPYNC